MVIRYAQKYLSNNFEKYCRILKCLLKKSANLSEIYIIGIEITMELADLLNQGIKQNQSLTALHFLNCSFSKDKGNSSIPNSV